MFESFNTQVDDKLLSEVLLQNPNTNIYYRCKWCTSYNNLLVSITDDSIYIVDKEFKTLVRCPKAGDLIYAERLGSSYLIFYKANDGVVIADEIYQSTDNQIHLTRRTTYVYIKEDVKSMHSSESFFVITDSNNNIYLIEKTNIKDQIVSKIFKSASFVLDEKKYRVSEINIEESSDYIYLYLMTKEKIFICITLNKETFNVLSVNRSHFFTGVRSYSINGMKDIYKYLNKKNSKINGFPKTIYNDGEQTYLTTSSGKTCYNYVLTKEEDEIKLAHQFETKELFSCMKAIKIQSNNNNHWMYISYKQTTNILEYYLVNEKSGIEKHAYSHASISAFIALLNSGSSIERESLLEADFTSEIDSEVRDINIGNLEEQNLDEIKEEEDEEEENVLKNGEEDEEDEEEDSKTYDDDENYTDNKEDEEDYKDEYKEDNQEDDYEDEEDESEEGEYNYDDSEKYNDLSKEDSEEENLDNYDNEKDEDQYNIQDTNTAFTNSFINQEEDLKNKQENIEAE